MQRLKEELAAAAEVAGSRETEVEEMRARAEGAAAGMKTVEARAEEAEGACKAAEARVRELESELQEARTAAAAAAAAGLAASQAAATAASSEASPEGGSPSSGSPPRSSVSPEHLALMRQIAAAAKTFAPMFTAVKASHEGVGELQGRLAALERLVADLDAAAAARAAAKASQPAAAAAEMAAAAAAPPSYEKSFESRAIGPAAAAAMEAAAEAVEAAAAEAVGGVALGTSPAASNGLLVPRGSGSGSARSMVRFGSLPRRSSEDQSVWQKVGPLAPERKAFASAPRRPFSAYVAPRCSAIAFPNWLPLGSRSSAH